MPGNSYSTVLYLLPIIIMAYSPALPLRSTARATCLEVRSYSRQPHNPLDIRHPLLYRLLPILILSASYISHQSQQYSNIPHPSPPILTQPRPSICPFTKHPLSPSAPCCDPHITVISPPPPPTPTSPQHSTSTSTHDHPALSTSNPPTSSHLPSLPFPPKPLRHRWPPSHAPAARYVSHRPAATTSVPRGRYSTS